jgi:hypothetical protein
MNHIYLTQAFSITSLILSMGFLFHLKHYEQMAKKMVGEPSGFILGGVLPLLVGSLIIFFPYEHNHHWNALYIIGWILFLVAVFRIWFVHYWIKILKDNMTFIPILFSLFGLILGMLLFYSGFIAPLYR